ncbi:CD109 antigen-like [Planococcus citri]|uniref:CD109 antigen-like n=1 Tax=Planococcus citri TaxID=170843 RepID=UPI0031F833E7
MRWLYGIVLVFHLAFAQNPFAEFGRPNQGSQSSVNSSPWTSNVILNEATFFVVASRVVRPAQVYRVAATVYSMKHPLTIRSSIQRNGVEVAADSRDVKKGISEVLLMRIPATSVSGNYKLKVEGLYSGILGGAAFVNETKLIFSQRSMTIYIQTDKPIYKQSETVKLRAIPITTELRAFDGIIDVYMLDPKKRIMKRWLSRQSNLGTVSLEYELSDQPVFGEWTIRVLAQGQVEESTFLVEEYYQTRFEVNITMAPFIFTTDQFLTGTVMANYTGGAPVVGNLTLKASVRPFKTSNIYIKDFTPISEKHFYFDESYPFWYPQQKRDNLQRIPHLTWFRGTYQFQYPVQDLVRDIPNLDEYEVVITATVGERFLDEIVEGYSVTRFFNSSVKVFFLGSEQQVFKPTSPFSVYLGVSFHDGSPLPLYRLMDSRLELAAEVIMKSSGRNSIDIPVGKPENGIWTLKIDLRSQLGLANTQQGSEVLKDVDSIHITATFRDIASERSYTELYLQAYYSPTDHFIKVSTSTTDARVGEYIMFHVHSNFQMEVFDYVLLSKGIILLAAQETTSSSVYTFAVTLSAEMAPSATIVVYHVGKFGDIIADSLTFPVNGISRNNFTVFINNRKARTGEIVEVAVYGEPGAYVGLSGLDRPFYSLQLGNELTYARVLSKMNLYDHEGNSSFLHTWLSHSGDPDDIVHLPSSSHGIDANQTFTFAGLIVFTDVVVPRKTQYRNYTMGYTNTYRNAPTYNMTELNLFRKMRYNRIQRHYENVWLWRDINIGPHGRYIFEIPVPHKPAHWMITAFSVSQSFGFGMIQKPIEYMGILPFFINVEMPTRSRQGEQVGVRVTVFNYMKNAIEAVVLLEGSDSYKFVHVEEEGIVSSYSPRTSFGEHQFFVYIKAQDAVIVYLPIVPVKLGDIEVSVRATTLIASDRVSRILHVEADGLPQYRHESVLLDLTNRAYIFQYMHVNVTETPIIPYDIDRYYIYGSNKASISVVGDVVGPIFPTMPVNATSLLSLPMDGAEQTVFGFAVMMYTTIYMRLINARNRTQEKYSFHHMNIQYQRLISFMNDDGSFSLFRSDWDISPKSVWLTAHCIRILQDARFSEWENYLFIDPEIITKSLSWLLLHQTEEGAFYDVSWIPDRKANISAHLPSDYKHRNISLTAQVLIALTTVKDVGSLGGQVSNAQLKAIQWLEQNAKIIDLRGDSYEVAVVAYALMLAKAASAGIAFDTLNRRMREEGGFIYWGRDAVPLPPNKLENQKSYLLPRLPYKYDSMNIEATAYALLVYVQRQQEGIMEGIVKWLNTQRLTDGGWASTQDTAVAIKALMEYTNRQRTRDVSGLSVKVEATALGGHPRWIYVNNKNLATLQKMDIPHAWGTVKVEGRGAGYAILQMHVQYNVDIAKFQTQPPVQAFSLVPKAHFHGRNQSHIMYYSCQRWTYLNESLRSGMAVLDVTIPTGYIIQQQNLDRYVRSGNIPNLKRARFLEQKVLFYFDYLDDSETCIRFTIERWLPVANMSRYLPIRVYDYYAPERFNETIFDATPTYLLSICEVCGSSQCPYCPIYNTAVVFKATILFSILFTFVVRYLR